MTSTSTDRRFGLASSVAIKAPVKCATTANITLSGTQTIDGIAAVADDRVLVKDQTNQTENGIYKVSASAWTRDIDFNGSRDVVEGTRVYINSGTANGAKEARCTTSGDITFGTTNVAFTLYDIDVGTVIPRGDVFTSSTTDPVNGVNAAFTLTSAPGNENAVTVTFDGATQHRSTYSLSGAELTFSTAPPATVSEVEVSYGEKSATAISSLEDDPDPMLSAPLNANGNPILLTKGSDIASASPLVVGTDGSMFDVTGTTGFSAMTVAAGTLFMLQFDDVLTMTHEAGTLDLPGAANITTGAGDSCLCYATTANAVRVISYDKADPSASTTIEGLVELATQSETDARTDTGRAITPSTLPSGWELVTATDASAASSVAFTSGIDSTFSRYAVVFCGVTFGSDGSEIFVRTSTNGGSSYDSGASDYDWSGYLSRSAQASVEKIGSGAANGIRIGGSGIENPGNASGEGFEGILFIDNPSNASLFTKMSFHGSFIGSGGTYIQICVGGARMTAQDTDAIQISGPTSITGSINLYGVRG